LGTARSRGHRNRRAKHGNNGQRQYGCLRHLTVPGCPLPGAVDAPPLCATGIGFRFVRESRS
jgi:hypothetical protein